MSVYVGSVCIMGTTGTNAFLYWISIYLQYSHGCQRVPSLYVYVLGHGKVWVPRVPTHFCIKSPTECVYVWGVWIMGTTGTNTFLFVLNRRLNVCVCVWGACIMGTTGTNMFLYWISIYLQYCHRDQWVPSLYVYVPGHDKLWVPRVPTRFGINSPTECVYVWGVCIMGTTGTNTFLYWISIYLLYSHGYQRVASLYVYVPGYDKLWVTRVPTRFCINCPTEWVCVWGVCIMGTTGTNTFLY